MSNIIFPSFFTNRIDFSKKIKSGRPSVISHEYSAGTIHGTFTISEVEPVRILEKLPKNNEKRKSRTVIYINVNCSCGSNIWMKASYLSRKPTACFMCRAERRKGLFKKLPIEYKKWHQRYNEIKKRSKKNGMDFNLTPEYLKKLFEKQEGICAITGKKIELTKGNLSLDRINPSKGYTMGNVQWTIKKINMIKQEMTMKELVEFCQIINTRYEKGLLNFGT